VKPQHRTGSDGAFYLDLTDDTTLRFGSAGCDPATISADDAGLVAAYMAVYDATTTSVSFAATLENARAAYTWMTGEEA
jgi:hypothetical protein